MLVVSDTGPISSLYKIGQLHLLKALYEDVVLPAAVLQELLQNPEFKDVDWRSKGFRVEASLNYELLIEISKQLDPGEAPAITYAITHNVAYVLIDEADGRRIARQYNLPTIGTLGILLRAKQSGFTETVKPHVERLRTIGFYLHQNLYREILQLAQEQ